MPEERPLRQVRISGNEPTLSRDHLIEVLGRIPATLSKKILYNRKTVDAYYPKVRLDSPDRAIEEMVEHELGEYLREWGPSP